MTAQTTTQQNMAILLYRMDELTKALAATTEEMQSEFKEIRVAIKGNGKPGIEQRTSNLERQLGDMISVMKKHQEEHAEALKAADEERKEIEKEGLRFLSGYKAIR